MRKNYPLQKEKQNPDRIVEAVKNDIRKYLKRERKKTLPEGTTFWDFECMFGKSSDDAVRVTTTEMMTALDSAHAEKWEQCYVQIESKATFKPKSETAKTPEKTPIEEPSTDIDEDA